MDGYKSVFKKVEAIFKVFVEKGLTPVRSITKDLVSITNDNRVDVLCVFCASNSEEIPVLQKKIIIPRETRGSTARYWNYGNLKTHLNRHFKQMIDSTKLIESMPLAFEPSKNDQLQNESPPHDKINELFDLISAQNSSLIATNEEFNEDQRVMNFTRNNRLGIVKVVNISPDGNCLFSACVHQLYRVKVNSDDHKMIAIQLRERVCSYITNNFSRFQRTIKLRMKHENPDESDASIEIKITSFVEDFLSKSKFWGGTESLVAIGEIFEANIIIFIENGHCYFANGRNDDYKRFIFLAYRRFAGKDGAYNHYDSVSEIYQQELYDCASNLCGIGFGENDVETVILE